MFSTGQLIFAGIFLIVFIGVMIYVYRKDLKLHKRYYKGTIWVLFAFISFLLMLVAVKFLSL